MPTHPWWKKTTIYQIYPRSFQDSNHDGIGDIDGIVSRLDYCKDLGVETIWFSPLFASPQQDFGYDISDYRNIAPEYGTLESCLFLIDEIHRREMKVLFDLVMNHTSDRHPWFLESKSSRGNPKRDWYIWKDGKKPGGKAPPNNWRSYLADRGWHYHEETDQWYWASFLPFQPDLNYRNPDVKEAMLDMVRFWLDHGVDGFRLDIFDAIYKDPEFRDNPFKLPLFSGTDVDRFLPQKRTMNRHHPDTIAFAKELRGVLEEFGKPERFLIGEVSGDYETVKRYCGDDTPDGLHAVFLFQTLNTKLQAKELRELITSFERHFPAPFVPTWVFSNHDCMRRISFLGNDEQKAKLNAAFQLTARGIPVVYYGEEIGMRQCNIPFDQARDPIATRFKDKSGIIRKMVMRLTHGAANRDNCRTPMQWNDSFNAGFCTEAATPWLPVNADYLKVNVNKEKLDQNSLYHCYRRFLRARKENPALSRGDITLLSEESLPRTVLAYRRRSNSGHAAENAGSQAGEEQEAHGSNPQVDAEQKLFVYLNCGREPVTVPLTFDDQTTDRISDRNPTPVVSTEADGGKIETGAGGTLHLSLSSYECVVVNLSP